MTNIILKSKVLTVTYIMRKTTAKLFKDLKVGSRLELSVGVEVAGTRRGRTYATGIKVKDLDTGEVVVKTFNELPKFLNLLEFSED